MLTGVICYSLKHIYQKESIAMKLERPAPGTGKTKKATTAFGKIDVDLPDFDKPISIKENFYRALKHQDPCWVPFTPFDMQERHMTHLADKGPEGYFLGPDLSWKCDRFTYLDPFGNSWTFDPNAGGACMTYGTRICDDILKWEEQVKFPDFHEWNLEERAERYMKEEYDPERVMHIDIYHGPYQALADVLGSFSDALEAMFVEPEATRAFFDRFTDWMIWLMEKLSSLYPVDLFTIHDDWGTEKDAFFSPAMMEDLLFEPTKKMIDYVHSKGKLYQFHCCGRVDKFMDAFCELGPDLMQLQRRVNDLPKYKELYGDKLGFSAGLEGYIPRKPYTHDELIKLVRDSADIFAPNGGWVPGIYGLSPAQMWEVYSELYCYSSEMYANK